MLLRWLLRSASQRRCFPPPHRPQAPSASPARPWSLPQKSPHPAHPAATPVHRQITQSAIQVFPARPPHWLAALQTRHRAIQSCSDRSRCRIVLPVQIYRFLTSRFANLLPSALRLVVDCLAEDRSGRYRRICRERHHLPNRSAHPGSLAGWQRFRSDCLCPLTAPDHSRLPCLPGAIHPAAIPGRPLRRWSLAYPEGTVSLRCPLLYFLFRHPAARQAIRFLLLPSQQRGAPFR